LWLNYRGDSNSFLKDKSGNGYDMTGSGVTISNRVIR